MIRVMTGRVNPVFFSLHFQKDGCKLFTFPSSIDCIHCVHPYLIARLMNSLVALRLSLHKVTYCLSDALQPVQRHILQIFDMRTKT